MSARGHALVVCPCCGRAEFGYDGGRCAGCGEWLPPAVQALTAEDFDSSLVEAGRPTVVHFWAPWCGPCSVLGPVFADAASYRRDVGFAACNVDEAEAIAVREDIANLPTLVYYTDGREIGRISGTMRLEALLDWLDRQAAIAGRAA
ncbi:thioredoxin family protein [Solimonas variicoloris]|uniref:thioredoxin family protein n=1 Tax=Solimonas variicoloris TaxID=254408 RepID=UPI0003815DBC|nr:thioredoxin family protein [Solimonas variicoloris]